jgi:hypothetical protein
MSASPTHLDRYLFSADPKGSVLGRGVPMATIFTRSSTMPQNVAPSPSPEISTRLKERIENMDPQQRKAAVALLAQCEARIKVGHASLVNQILESQDEVWVGTAHGSVFYVRVFGSGSLMATSLRVYTDEVSGIHAGRKPIPS